MENKIVKNSIKLKSIFLAICFFVFFSTFVNIEANAGQAYYVDFTNGNDSNAGTQAQPIKYHPWMGEYTGSITLQAGDMVYMKRGEEWLSANPLNNNGFIQPSSSGTEGNLITTSAYGTGVKPKIKITDFRASKSVIYVSGYNYLKFDNLDLQHSLTSYVIDYSKSGIHIINDGHHIYITNNEISYVSMGIVGFQNTYHLYVGDMNATTTATSTSYSNYIHHFAHSGVNIQGGYSQPAETNAYVYYNYIKDGGFEAACRNDIYGITATALNSSRMWPKNVYIRYNRIEDIPSWTGVDTHGASYLYVEDNYIYNTAIGIITIASVVGSLPVTGDHYYIRNNTVENPQTIACPDWLRFITVKSRVNNAKVDPVEITGNTLLFTQRPTTSWAQSYIRLRNVQNALVEGNHIYNGPTIGSNPAIDIDSAYSANSNNVTIRRNNIHDVAVGIEYDSSAITDKLPVHYNIIRNVDHAFKVLDSDIAQDVDLYNNIFMGNSNNALIFWSSTLGIASGVTMNIKNNIIAFDQPRSGKYISSGGSQSGILNIGNNLYYRSTYSNPLNPPGTSEQDWSGWQGLGYDTSGKGPNIDPLFTDESSNDFHIQANSPAIKAGVNVGLSSDFDGNVLVGDPDIGVFEFSGVPVSFNYTLTNSGNTSVIQGSSVSNTVNASLVSGATQSVSYSALGLPQGATASFSPISCLPDCSTTLTINTSGSTPTGTYTITVTGTGGEITKTSSFNLAVNSSSPPPSQNSITSLKTNTTITKDGTFSENVWNQANYVTFSNPSRSDNQVKVYTLYDDNNLYFAYEVTDAQLEATNVSLYQDDGVELFIDTQNNKTTSMDSNDYHFFININDLTLGGNINTKTITNQNGYTMEIAIPWTAINITPTPNMTMGLLLTNNDRDNGISSQFDWLNLIETGLYARPNLWGDIILSSQVVLGDSDAPLVPVGLSILSQ